MSSEIRKLEPVSVWNKFADLNEVPRPSKKEERVIAFMKSFGESLGLETKVDKIGNVFINKPATPGLEDRKTVVMQSHLDMVHQKNADTVFDFDTQGIEMYVEGDWVKAAGTTLGADNGLGVATIMAILESTDIPHPAIEALFTIDEETGMTGAMGLEAGWLTGDILLNLDTEEDDEIGVGCAGGIDVTASMSYKEETLEGAYAGYSIAVRGLNGGHSGMDIHKGLGNANKIMNRVLHLGITQFGLRVHEVRGGSLRNAIPRESFAKVQVPVAEVTAFEAESKRLIATIKNDFSITEADLEIVIENTEVPLQVVSEAVSTKLIKAIYAAHNGVYRMSPSIADLVEASNNIAKVTIGGGEVIIECLTRSSVESSKEDVVNTLTATFELCGCQVKTSGDYPGWAPNMESPILKVLDTLYQKLNGEKAHIAACHAGLECGILGQNYPDMDMISFGPTILGAHSPDERASISSLQKYWKFVKEILANIPKQ
ncbi:aminoacyl-histidine dipeptidase [Aquimarina sp. TRL1]|uniref:aminoacyl-histidine dipeptidase n=1 Tax=Aquimarina sp. (strain TRL1) TaxID=2736252 RepID=UPI00158F3417|nr:aminoacyl-histidine dipeptidase [Aquimarina sp. TRL1]QKX05969.1 aminoacyl-histidine dipeptidase [Aquimarina sp. TRL1]